MKDQSEAINNLKIKIHECEATLKTLNTIDNNETVAIKTNKFMFKRNKEDAKNYFQEKKKIYSSELFKLEYKQFISKKDDNQL